MIFLSFANRALLNEFETDFMFNLRIAVYRKNS